MMKWPAFDMGVGQIIEYFRQHKLKSELTTFSVETRTDDDAEHARQRFEVWGRDRMMDYQDRTYEE